MWFEAKDIFINAKKIKNIRRCSTKVGDSKYKLYIYANSSDTECGEILMTYEDDNINRFNYVEDNIVELIRTKLALNNTEVLDLYKEAFRLQAEYDCMT